ncbi:MAG: hypothetical protein ACI92I_000969 [Acidimicrobiales bacterium]|jgi:hypothetical protein
MTLHIFTTHELQNPEIKRGVTLSQAETYIDSDVRLMALIYDADDSGHASPSTNFADFLGDLEGQVDTEVVRLESGRTTMLMIRPLAESDVDPEELLIAASAEREISFSEVYSFSIDHSGFL